MEFFTEILDMCSFGWRPYKYEVDEIVLHGHKALTIKFIQIDPYEINWIDANCTISDGELTLYYQDVKTIISFDKKFDYAQATMNKSGNDLIITIPSRIKIVSMSLRDRININSTSLNNDR